jgi:hypothetical protein
MGVSRGGFHVVTRKSGPAANEAWTQIKALIDIRAEVVIMAKFFVIALDWLSVRNPR